MASRNSILLVIKQNPGIEYPVLINKVAGDYGNVNSARAAMSRFMKEALAFGWVEKKDNAVMLTGKGESQITQEMKDRLVIGLNELILDHRPSEAKIIGDENPSAETEVRMPGKKRISKNTAEIVRQLTVLIEKAKQDAGLLASARNASEFSIHDLEELLKKENENIKQLNYLTKVFEDQIAALKEMNFNESHQIDLDEKGIPQINAIVQALNVEEITLEIKTTDFLAWVSQKFNVKPKGTTLAIKPTDFLALLPELKNFTLTHLTEEILIYLPEIKIALKGNQAFILLPYKKAKELKLVK